MLSYSQGRANTGPLRERLTHLLSALGEGLYERQEAIQLGLLAALAGESVFLLGPPGIAKSMIARRLKQAFQDGQYFEYLMTRFSTPEEVFGPLSIQALKEQGKYLRLTQGYLPDAQVVFLDEIWKAGPAILNTLLSAINERQFRNGEHLHAIPLRLLISAANELPAPDSGLEALYDRMLVRLWLDRLQEKHNFQALLASSQPVVQIPPSLAISSQEYQRWQQQIERVRLPDSCFELIYLLRQQINQQLGQRCYVSDRRWKKAVRLIKASAFFNGREELAPLDVLLLKDCLWHDEASRHDLQQLMAEFARLYCYQQLAMTKQINSLNEQLLAFSHQISKRLAFTATQRKHWFGRKARGIELKLAAAKLFAGKVHLQLLTPARLDSRYPELESDTLIFDKQRLSHWHPTGQAIPGFSLGNPNEVRYELNIDEHRQLHVFDIERKAVPMVLVERQGPSAAVVTPWLESLARYLQQCTQLRQQLKQQRSLFEHQQPHLFVSKQWLSQIEDSFFVLERDVNKLEQTLLLWQTRLPTLGH